VDTFGVILKPSIINQYEVGVKTMLFNNLVSVNATGYIINNSNAVQSYPNLSPTDSRREIGGQTQSKGVELDVVTKSINGFNINSGYSYNDIRYKKNVLLYVPGSRILIYA